MQFSDYIVTHSATETAYHLPVSRRGFIPVNLFDNVPFALETEDAEDLYRFAWENGISPLWDEHAVLFAIALRRLRKEYSCLMVIHNTCAEIRQFLPEAEVFPVLWWYGISWMEGDEQCRELGMCQPKVVVGTESEGPQLFGMFPDEVQTANYTKLFHSDVTNWFFVFMEEGQEANVKKLLTDAEQRPDSLLAHCVATVNVQIGSDEGYLNYLLLRSHHSHDLLMAEIADAQRRFLQAYTWLLGECKPFDVAWKVDFFKEQYTELLASL